MRKLLLLVVVLLLLAPGTLRAQGQADLGPLKQHVQNGIEAAGHNDTAAMRREADAIEASWAAIEDGVRAQHRDLYIEIEDALAAAREAAAANPPKATAMASSLTTLQHELQELAKPTPGSSAATNAAAPANVSLAALLPKLKEAETALERGDTAAAARELKEFQQGWPDVEGAVAAKDAAVYRHSEELMASASNDLSAQPPRTAPALTAIGQLSAGLTPFASESMSYGVFDAAAILLREGLEAFLIIAALLAFLQKSGNGDKRVWIWAGGLAGVLVSILVAVLIQHFFSSVVTGANREIVEGITGLVAAAMLFYVSFWLHRKSQLQGWQRYIRERTNAALATGSLFSLAMLSFLAVFREGAETTLFYLGIAPSIAQRDLWLGLLIAAAILVVACGAILVLGRRLPLRPFFRVTSLLIFYLGFKFIGAGVHALQVAGVIPASTSGYLPSIDMIGLYPTWESTTLQVALLVLAAAIVLWLNHRQPRSERTSVAA